MSLIECPRCVHAPHAGPCAAPLTDSLGTYYADCACTGPIQLLCERCVQPSGDMDGAHMVMCRECVRYVGERNVSAYFSEGARPYSHLRPHVTLYMDRA